MRPLKKNNFGPRLGLAYRVTDKTLVSTGYGLIWIEMAGITTPFTTPSFPFLQTVSQRALDTVTPAFVLQNGPSVAPIAPTPTAGLGQGVFGVDAHARLRLRAAVERVACSASSRATRPSRSAYVGSKITHVGIPDTNLNQLTVDQLAHGRAAAAAVPNPVLRHHPALVVARRSDDSGGAAAQAVPAVHDREPLPQQRRDDGLPGRDREAGAAALRAGCRISSSYTRSRLKDDASSVFDASILTGPVANYPVADSFNRRLERDYSTGDIPHVFVASAVWDLPWGRGAPTTGHGILGALGRDWTLAAIVTLQSGIPVAVTQTTNFNAFAGFGTQRPNLVGDPELPADERIAVAMVQHRGVRHRAAVHAGLGVAQPGSRARPTRTWTWRSAAGVPVGGGTALELRAEAFNLLNTPPFGNPNGVAGTAAFGTITTAGDPRVVQLAVKYLF